MGCADGGCLNCVYNQKVLYNITLVYMLCIEVPVSMGEIFDKLSILEIKRDKLHDERRVEVEKEYHALFDKVHHLFSDDILFHYCILKTIKK
jgi:hypothetical protein